MFRIFKKEQERKKENETKNHEKNSKTKKPETKPMKKEKTQVAAALTGRPSIAPTRAERDSVPLTGGA
jgi:hypothetical protein